MKIAIISDSHDNWPNISKVLNYLENQNINLIIHCGDVSSAEVLKEMGKHFTGQIHTIFGNVSGSPESMNQKAQEAGNVTTYDETGKLELDGKKIAWNHFPWDAKKLAQTGKYDLVFYGHDHKPWEKQIGPTKMLNPGTLAGLFNKATFAIYDTTTDKAELILLEKMTEGHPEETK